MAYEIDEKDKRLIALLRHNARTPVVTLAKDLGVSRATVQNRLNRLESEGVIQGYSVLLASADAATVKAFVSIEVDANQERQIVSSLKAHPEITAVHHTSGQWDFMLEISTDSLAQLNALVSELRRVKGILKTDTSLVLNTV